jgi:glutathione S-transferase
MKLWHCRDARSLRALWALEEMVLPYEVEVLPFPPRVLAKEYLSVNPLGTVPYFMDGEAHMTESTAICHYLVERYGRHDFGLTANHPEYGAYLNWLYQSDATLTFPQTIYLRYARLEPAERRLPQAADDYRKWYLARLKLLDAHLADHDYLCDGRFTIAADALLPRTPHRTRWLPASTQRWCGSVNGQSRPAANASKPATTSSNSPVI